MLTFTFIKLSNCKSNCTVNVEHKILQPLSQNNKFNPLTPLLCQSFLTFHFHRCLNLFMASPIKHFEEPSRNNV